MEKVFDTFAAILFVTVKLFWGAVSSIPTSHDVASLSSPEARDEAGLTRAYTRTRSGSASANFCGDILGVTVRTLEMAHVVGWNRGIVSRRKRQTGQF
tara:strand:- start:43411 stop:43704 length:294 start_codon:yes stop_codon:yes gene_type:complete